MATCTCQTSKAAVSKRGVTLFLVDVLKMVPQFTESIRQVAFDAEIAHGVAEETADEELQRKIVHANIVTIADRGGVGREGGGSAKFIVLPPERSAGWCR